MAESVAARGHDATAPLSRATNEPASRALFRLVWGLNFLLKRVTKRVWLDQQKVPATGGAVFVVNHISNIDPLAFGQYVAWSGRWPRLLGKASVFRVPVLGRILLACEQIPVERGNSREAAHALDQAVAAVIAGKCVTVYPEGTITRDPNLWPMTGKSGAARIAFESGCPVIPFGQWGAQDLMPGSDPSFPRFFPRKTLRVKAGDPVDLDDLRGQPRSAAVLAEATDRIMDAITELVADLRGEEPPAVRFDPRASTTTKPPAEGPL